MIIVSYYTALYQFEAKNLLKSLENFLPEINSIVEEYPESGSWEKNRSEEHTSELQSH